MDYLVIENNTVTQICTSIEDLLKYLNIELTSNGIINVRGEQFSISYNMQEFTREEIVRDIEHIYLKKFECMLKIGIYKLKRI